jgi:hypothetical protein
MPTDPQARTVPSRFVFAYAPFMRRSALALALVFALAACRSSTPGAVEPPSSAGLDAEAPPIGHGEQLLPFDLERFEAPFGRLPLSAAFVRAHGLRRVVVHEDANTEDVQLVDVEVAMFDYDREGRPLRASTQGRGEPRGEVHYEHADGRLVTERHAFPDGTHHVIRYSHDAAGRVQRIERELPHGTIEEQHAYDEHGRPSRVVEIEGGRRAERSFVYDGDRLRRVVLRLADGDEIVTEHTYGADGRPTRWVSTNAAGRVDTYELTWDARGWLRSQSFTEDDAPIYRRTYAYDEDGRPIREELQSFVPAMGHGSVVRYEYERHGELPREPAARAGAEPTKAELLAATVTAFRGAYEELAVVSFESGGQDRFAPASVTVYIPEAIVGERSEEELREQACKANQALGWECHCQSVKLGEPQDFAWHSWPDKRVVPLTLRFGLGC